MAVAPEESACRKQQRERSGDHDALAAGAERPRLGFGIRRERNDGQLRLPFHGLACATGARYVFDAAIQPPNKKAPDANAR